MDVSASDLERDAVDELVEQWKLESPEIDASPMQILARLHRLYLRYSSAIAETFSEFGINSASFDVLAALKRSGDPYSLSPGQLARTSLVTTAGITMRLDRIEKAGLVARTRDKEDRRLVHVRLTAKGLHVVESASALHFKREQAMLADLEPAERETLVRLLRRLGESFDSYQFDRAQGRMLDDSNAAETGR